MWSKICKMFGKTSKVSPLTDEESKTEICTCSQYHFHGNCPHILCV